MMKTKKIDSFFLREREWMLERTEFSNRPIDTVFEGYNHNNV
jgi:hypothetical protein